MKRTFIAIFCNTLVWAIHIFFLISMTTRARDTGAMVQRLKLVMVTLTQIFSTHYGFLMEGHISSSR